MEKVLSYIQSMPTAVRSAYLSILMFLVAIALIFIVEYNLYETPPISIKSYHTTEMEHFSVYN